MANNAGYVNIIFPVSFAFSRGTTTFTVKDTTSATSPTSTTCTLTSPADTNNMGNYVSRLICDLKCGTISCAGSAQFTLTVTGYFN